MKTIEAIRYFEFLLRSAGRTNMTGMGSTVAACELALAALQDRFARENTRPLTVEELMKRDDPVWVSCKTLEGTDGYWCICQKGVIICPSGQSYDVRDIPHWKFYRWRVEPCSK